MINKSLGIYIHIPFCERKCRYCDFLSFSANEGKKKKYVDALIREIRASEFSGRKADTVFFGGGTPSVLTAEDTVRIMEAVRETFMPDTDTDGDGNGNAPEITTECNPKTVTPEKLAAYRKAGINRISFGLQSADVKELKLLGRIHSFTDFEESLNAAKEAGFENINADLMMGLPGQRAGDLMKTLEKVCDMGLKHISLYSLILEEGTPLADNIAGFPPLPDEDEERRMYHEAVSFLENRGFHRYEISNFAKKGFECRHNLKYWDLDEYMGFGIGAASFAGGRRFSNTKDFEEYVRRYGGQETAPRSFRKAKGTVFVSPEGRHRTVLVYSLMSEFMFLGLRKTKGIRSDDFTDRFGEDVIDIYGDVIKRQTEEGTLVRTKEGYALTERGIDVSNYVLADYILE